MHGLQWYDFLRMITAVCAAWSLFKLVISARSRWHIYTTTDKDYLWCFAALLFLLIEGNIEVILRNRGYSASLIIGCLASMVCVKATRRRFMQEIADDYMKGLQHDD